MDLQNRGARFTNERRQKARQKMQWPARLYVAGECPCNPPKEQRKPNETLLLTFFCGPESTQ